MTTNADTPAVTVRETVVTERPLTGARKVEVRMKVDDSYVTFKADLDAVHRGFTRPWGNPSVPPTDAQFDAARAVGRRTAEALV